MIPWGPWSPPQDLIVAGIARSRRGTSTDRAACSITRRARAKVARRLAQFPADDYGWFYGANIIEEWTRPAGDGVDVIWLASTWDPYRVIMLRTRISK